MSKEVKRYEPTMDSAGRFFVEEKDGRAVMFRDYQKLSADYEALLAERDRLREALVTARDWIDFSKGAFGGGTTILEEIDAALQGQQP